MLNTQNSIFNEETKTLKEDFAPEEFYNDKQGEQKITVYPNPTAGQMVVQITPLNNTKNTKLEIYDISGKLILKKKNLAEFSDINISSSPSGEYVMKILLMIK